MARLNDSYTFNGKKFVTTKNNKLPTLDGSNLTNIKFTQLADTPNMLQANKILRVNSLGDQIELFDLSLPNNDNYSVVYVTATDVEDSYSWDNSVLNIAHNLNGLVFVQVYDESTGEGVPVVPNYISENIISFDVPSQYIPTADKRLIVLFTKGGIQYNYQSWEKPICVSTIADSSYGEVASLDSIYNFVLMGTIQVSKLRLRVVSADPLISGNINIIAFGQSFTIPVTNTPQWVDIIPSQTYEGLVNVYRDVSNTNDTLKEYLDSGYNVITCKIINWRIYSE